MDIFIILIHVIVSVALILIVLLQTGKGADMGAAFGGGSSQTLFGSTGASSFLSRMTTVAAIVFMLTSLSLAYLSGGGGTSSIMSDAVPVAEEAQQVPMPPESPAPSGHEAPAAIPAPEAGQPAAEPAPEPETK
ncbi:MAG: preprotein translocase subunit SecG [Thermodesulfobacteriota bacterium]|nr:preprotein translocase subunit SecG [Thermodesulfobacteriota bacterium]